MLEKELYMTARRGQSPEELLKVARENHMNITPEKAEELFDRYHYERALEDDELNNVSGGCGAKTKIIPVKYFPCPICGYLDKKQDSPMVSMKNDKKDWYYCSSCGARWKHRDYYYNNFAEDGTELVPEDYEPQ